MTNLSSPLDHRIYFVVLVACCFWLSDKNDAFGQLEPTPAAPTAQRDKPISYRELSMSIRRNESEINRLYTTMPIGDPDRQKDYLKKIDGLTETNERLRAQLYRAAVESFRRNPEGNPEAARLVYKAVMTKLDPRNPEDQFDPKGAQDLGFMMLEGLKDPESWPDTIDRPNLIYQVFRASFSVEDFQRANEMLTQLEQEKMIALNSAIRTQLSESTKKWERELLIRRFEKSTNDLPRVKFETSEGEFVVELYENHAPQTVANFISLVEKKFYDQLEFFQVETGVIAKTGCPDNLGDNDAGYRITNELEREQIRHNFAGSLSMLTSQDGTAGSQLQISMIPDMNNKLDGKHTVFGRVIEGLNVVYSLKPTSTKKNFKPSQIVKATVVRKREKQYRPTILRSSEQGTSDIPDNFSGR